MATRGSRVPKSCLLENESYPIVKFGLDFFFVFCLCVRHQSQSINWYILIFFWDRVRNLRHNSGHRRRRNQRERLGDTGGEEGPVQRICDGELLQEEEVHAVGVCSWINSQSHFSRKKKLKETCFRSLKFSCSTYYDNPPSAEYLTPHLCCYYE